MVFWTALFRPNPSENRVSLAPQTLTPQQLEQVVLISASLLVNLIAVWCQVEKFLDRELRERLLRGADELVAKSSRNHANLVYPPVKCACFFFSLS